MSKARNIANWLRVTATVVIFGLLTAVAIGVLAWIPRAWPGYAREERTNQLLILAILMACLAAACIGIIFKVVRPAATPEAPTSKTVLWLSFAASAGIGVFASLYSGDWAIAAGVGAAMVTAAIKLGIGRWSHGPDRHEHG
jgi:hypothetical protein